MSVFKLHSEFKPGGDQPKAISGLVQGVKDGVEHQTLLGVTGSGKTFTVANVIEQIGKPTLVIAHNKTLAAQLAQEYKAFFPNHAVHYFVSYYDFYQPEAYMPITDTYIEKEAQINAEIERLRHATTQALLTRPDVIVVASVSCIYGLGSPERYKEALRQLTVGGELHARAFIRDLVSLRYERSDAELKPGTFRVVGNTIEIMPVNEMVIVRLTTAGSTLEEIQKINAVSREVIGNVQNFLLFSAKHFVTPQDEIDRAVAAISEELEERLEQLTREGKPLEAERLKRRTKYDLALIKEIGYCNGIENYSRHFDGRTEGEPPSTLIDYFKAGAPDGFLTVIDESHVTVPQIAGMFAGDRARKNTLVEHGFRLPSAKDNRPLTFEEFEEAVGQVIYTSATPAAYELEHSKGHVVEQIIRPTGLIDPEISIEKVTGDGTYGGQVKHFIEAAETAVAKGHRVIATTLTKKMAEDLSQFLVERDVRAEYLHSDIETLERIELLTKFRKGEFDVLVGVNLLREGLDLPEVALIGIFDADKEGFLRSETSLIQTIGRAARNVEGHVILYADQITGSIERAVLETHRRRELQLAYNKEHGITPVTIKKKIADITEELKSERERAAAHDLAILLGDAPKAADIRKVIKAKEREMNEAVKILDFETAAILRDEIQKLSSNVTRKKKSDHH